MILAENAGFCFGVRRAVDMARKNAPAVTLGPIIHNPFAVERLRTEGVVSVDSVDDVAPESRVVIRSHGVSKAEYEALAAKNCRIVDATCPFVERIHEIARRTGEENRALIIIGAREHPEVKGILGWTDGRAWAVSSEEEIRDLPPLDDAVVVSQTTMPEARFDELLRLVEEKVAHVDVRRTICTATKLRQSEAVRIAARSQVMLVVGSRASSNSVKLWELCRQVLERTYLVETAREVYSIPVHKGENIGITAGASTPDCIIKEVVASMNDIEKQVTPSEEKQEQADASADFMADVEKTLVQIRPGQTITGTVVQITDDEVCVNVGYKADGLVKKSDLSSTDVKIGDEIEVEVVKVNDGEGNVLLSQRNLVNRKNWDEIVAKYEAGEFVQGVGKEAVKGGLLADVLGIRTFIPASQLSQRYVEKIDSFVGQEMNLKIIEVDKAKKRIVASRKAVLAVEEAERKKAIWATIEPGTIVKGVVRRLADFGAFVDIGGVDGLVHVTDLSWAHGLKPSDVVSVNQEIDVKILNVDPERERISLSYKATQPKPWVVAAELPVGSIVEGKVVRITTFGAFVELMPGLDGLVHISQCAPTRIAKVEDAVQVGQTVNVKILDVDVEKKRISLSIKEALGYEALNEPVGDKVEEEYAIKSEE